MKLNWKQWTGVGVCAALVVAEVVSCFVNPWAAVLGGVMLVGGAAGMYLLMKHDIVKEEA